MNIDKNLSKATLASLEKISGRKLTFGNLIWSIRECEEMSQVEFAKVIGVSKQYLCDLEHGRKVVSPKTAAKFAIILGYSVAQFVQLAIQDELDRYHLHFRVEVLAQDKKRAA